MSACREDSKSVLTLVRALQNLSPNQKGKNEVAFYINLRVLSQSDPNELDWNPITKLSCGRSLCAWAPPLCCTHRRTGIVFIPHKPRSHPCHCHGRHFLYKGYAGAKRHAEATNTMLTSDSPLRMPSSQEDGPPPTHLMTSYLLFAQTLHMGCLKYICPEITSILRAVTFRSSP